MQREHHDHAGRVDGVEKAHRQSELAAGKGVRNKTGEEQVDGQAADAEEKPAENEDGVAWSQGKQPGTDHHQTEGNVSGSPRRPTVDGRPERDRKQNCRDRDRPHQDPDGEVAEPETTHEFGDEWGYRKKRHTDGEEADHGGCEDQPPAGCEVLSHGGIIPASGPDPDPVPDGMLRGIGYVISGVRSALRSSSRCSAGALPAKEPPLALTDQRARPFARHDSDNAKDGTSADALFCGRASRATYMPPEGLKPQAPRRVPGIEPLSVRGEIS